MPWKFVIADSTGASLAEPVAFERSFTAGVSAVATAGFRIRQDEPMWQTIAAGDSTLKVYDSGGSLRLYGPVVSDEESASGSGASVRVSAADLAYRLSHRFFARDVTGVGVTYTDVDSGTIAYDVLSRVNSDAPTGISQGSADSGFVPRTLTYLWKKALDALNELGAIAGSYEWELRYVDGAPPVVYLDLLERLGTDRSESVFLEYGTGKLNVQSYKRTRSVDQMANDVWALGSSATLLSEAVDAESQVTYGLYQDVVTYGEITVSSLLDALAAGHVLFRAKPKQMIDLTPFPALAPKFGVDYRVGDIVATDVKVGDATRFTGFARVWGVTIGIDELGNEAPTLTLQAA